jgi:uncharacterized protein YjbI with pentapeptide repeats
LIEVDDCESIFFLFGSGSSGLGFRYSNLYKVMADPEHLKILKQGVRSWNKWRKEKPDVRPDLRKANLRFKDLFGVDLSWADLLGADLSFADLSEAKLVKAKLKNALLIRVRLSRSDLQRVCLRDADMIYADLKSANLGKSDLRGADLFAADLTGAGLDQAQIRDVRFHGANLKRASLKQADIRWSTLIRADLTGAVLTGAKLYGTARDDWVIKNVDCEYVCWDESGKERSPKDRDLEPGEFERLYASLPTIEYIFENGISPLDPLIMDRVVQAIREKRPEFDIKIDSINARGLAPSIKFTVQHEDHKDPALEEVRKGYETKLKQLESERDRYWEVIKAAFDKPREVKLITAGPGAIVATDGSTVNIQQHIHNVLELQKAIAKEPAESKTFAKIVKNKALDIIGKVLEDIAKGQVKEAAKRIIELGKDLGPIIAKTAAYAFFKSLM